MSIELKQTQMFVLNMRTRMAFKYGIATLTALPHLFVRATFEIDGRTQVGFAAEGLPPKWFTKDPQTTFEDDLADMLAVIESACARAEATGRCASVFEWWWHTYEAQQAWAQDTAYPPLLWSFGVSLIERAAIDAWCKAKRMPFADAVRVNALGLELERVHPKLAGYAPEALLPAEPQRRIAIRHTVGLGDPLTDDEIPDAERVDDGLPQSLAACMARYGLEYLKIKLAGDVEADRDRLKRIAGVLANRDGLRIAFTLDGNEQYRSVDAFQAFWQSLTSDAALAPFLSGLIVVEQPLHRDVALDAATARALNAWTDRPPIIIDESDAALGSVRTALNGGYIGTSHKNCKGVFKGLANACLLAARRLATPNSVHVLTGEDLANVGPIALLQDLAVMATLGLTHVERNGHHYFAGLSMLPTDLQAEVLDRHSDLYRRHEAGYPTLNVVAGKIELASVLATPFGSAVQMDVSRFEPISQWQFASLAED